MILVLKKTVIEKFAHLVQGIVAQENKRGDTLNFNRLLFDLTNGNQRMALVFSDKADEVPVMLFTYQEVPDSARDMLNVLITHIYVPDREKLAGYKPQDDVREFHALLEPYQEIMFLTDNPALPKVLERLGLRLTERAKLYNVVKETYADGRQ